MMLFIKYSITNMLNYCDNQKFCFFPLDSANRTKYKTNTPSPVVFEDVSKCEIAIISSLLAKRSRNIPYELNRRPFDCAQGDD